MDAISLVLTIIPLMLAVIFTMLSVKSLEELILEQVQSVLAPLWCALAAIFWTGFAIVSTYMVTIDYLANFGYAYAGVAVLFWVLFPVSILLDINLAASDKKKRDMDLELTGEEW